MLGVLSEDMPEPVSAESRGFGLIQSGQWDGKRQFRRSVQRWAWMSYQVRSLLNTLPRRRRGRARGFQLIPPRMDATANNEAREALVLAKTPPEAIDEALIEIEAVVRRVDVQHQLLINSRATSPILARPICPAHPPKLFRWHLLRANLQASRLIHPAAT